MTRRTLLSLFSAIGVAPAVASAQAKPDAVFKVRFTDAEWKQRLSPAQYEVLRQEGTERAVHQRVEQREAQGHVPLRRLRRCRCSART